MGLAMRRAMELAAAMAQTPQHRRSMPIRLNL